MIAMIIPQPLQKAFKYIDAHKPHYIAMLKEAVSFQSISSALNRRDECMKMMKWTEKCLRNLGGDTELCDNGMEVLPDGRKVKRLPVLLALMGKKVTKKKTLLVYGHMDVVPACIEDGWDSDPFVLEERDNKFYGRGASDNKGPVLSWFHAIESFLVNKLELPINIKFVLECSQEMGTEAIDQFMATKKTFFKDVDFVCICDGSWASAKKPSLSFGTRGLAFFSIEIEGPKKPLHSGTYGGMIHEPLADLIFLLDSLLDHSGKIQVPGMMDNVIKLTPEEETLYKSVNLDVEEMRKEAGVTELAHKENKMRLLMNLWRNPSLSFHGIECVGCDHGTQTLIPPKVIGKFSIRLVQHMIPDRSFRVTQRYLQGVFKLRKSPNTFKFNMLGNSMHWSENPLSAHYAAASKAVKYVHKTEPDFSREGTSIPMCRKLQEMTEKSVLLLPMGKRSDGIHGPNEKLDRKNYFEGIKVLAAYIYELSQIK